MIILVTFFLVQPFLVFFQETFIWVRVKRFDDWCRYHCRLLQKHVHFHPCFAVPHMVKDGSVVPQSAGHQCSRDKFFKCLSHSER